MENVDNSPDTVIASLGPAQPQNESESRNRNLDILKAYIHRQRESLERIKRDVERLHASKPALTVEPNSSLDRILYNQTSLRSGGREDSQDVGIRRGEKLNELVRDVHGVAEATIIKDIDWEEFRGFDPDLLHPLPSLSRPSTFTPHSYGHVPPPPTPSTPVLSCPKAPLSSFVFIHSAYDQNFKRKESYFQTQVRDMRSKIVEPALTMAAQFLATLPPDSDDEDVKLSKAKEARARDAKEARRIRLQNCNSDAKPSLKVHMKKSASRRKSEASAAAAATRPRGQGGRFKKKEQIADESWGSETQANGAQLSASVGSAPPIAEPELNSKLRRFPSSTASVISIDEGLGISEGRPQRSRKPSTRFGSVAPSVSSTVTTQSVSSTSRKQNGKGPADRQLSNGPLGGRLTIRIPARRPTKGVPYVDSSRRTRQVSASTSASASVSLQTSAVGSGQTSLTISPEDASANLGVKLYGGGSIAQQISQMADDEPTSSSPATTTRSTSQIRFVSVKQEENDNARAMDIDDISGWGAVGERNGRLKQDQGHELFPSLHGDLAEDYPESASDGSFVCERLPPVHGSSTASSVSHGGDGGSNSNGKYHTNRGSSRRGDKASKTFNMTWSDEEQRLLDMLLEQFPDGTKNRWAHISRAMGGTRTPRQVASRVQKYFAKMKKWGIDVG